MASKGCSFRPPNPQPFPWLMVFHGRSSKVTSFHSIVEKRDYVAKLPDFSNKVVCSHCNGWLLVTDDNFKLYLLNLVSMVRIYLPPLDDYLPSTLISALPSTSTEKIKHTIRKNSCILTAPPTDSACAVALFSNTLPTVLIWRPGQPDWVEQDYASDSRRLRVVTVCNKRIYGLDTSNYCYVCEIGRDGKLAQRRLALMPHGFSRLSDCLVGGSCGNIFAVQFSWWKPGNQRVESIRVFKFEKRNLSWVLVKDIGDNIFFIGHSQPISCLAANSGFKRGCILFTKARNLYTYDMEKNQINVSQVCPKAVHNRSPSLFIMVQP